MKENGLSVLLVEDESVTREKIAAILARERMTVYQEADGVAGLRAYGLRSPDIVITDIRMPVMNGLDMTREIKKMDPHAFVIVTTAHGDTEFLLDAIELGVNWYVLKPVNVDRLLEAVNRGAEVVRLRKEVMLQDREQKRLIEELKTALAEIRTLRGIIPICASCKKIRDDGGYWHQVEVYVRDHSEAQFSHGICPDCAEKLYPGYSKGKDGKD
jgi:YesN/AraC family two-component response regulator